MAMPDLEINGTTYRVEVHPYSHIRLYKLNDPNGAIYDVLFPGFDFPAACDCADYTFRRAGLDWSGCKHVKALTSVGLLPVVRIPQEVSR